MVKKAAKKSLRIAQKEDEYARLMAAKKGLPPPTPKPPSLKPEEFVDEQPFSEPVHVRPSGKGDDFPVMAKSVEQKLERPSSRITGHPSFADSFFCFICKSAACCLGTASRSFYVPPRWFCDECGIEAAKELQDMRNGRLNRIEDKATLAASEASGKFLDGLGETDLAKLSPQDYQAFCRRLVASYISHARQIARTDYPPED